MVTFEMIMMALLTLVIRLSDETPENQELADELWKKVGIQYLQENEDEYKDEINFPKRVDTSEGIRLRRELDVVARN